jgi:hypothetical protein
MKGGTAAVVLIATVAVMAIVGVSLFYGWAYPDYQYPMQKASDYLNLAGATANLTQIAGYVSNSYQLVQNFSGNPVWWYPTPDTSWGLLKADMISTISIAEHVAANSSGPDSYAYQQEVSNIHTNLIPNIQNRLSDITTNYMESVKTLPGQVGIVEIAVDVVAFLGIAAIVLSRVED